MNTKDLCLAWIAQQKDLPKRVVELAQLEETFNARRNYGNISMYSEDVDACLAAELQFQIKNKEYDHIKTETANNEAEIIRRMTIADTDSITIDKDGSSMKSEVYLEHGVLKIRGRLV